MSKPVVLIVEDDNIARFVFKKLITRLGYTPHEATNGKEALEMIDQHKDITHVYLDLNMPVFTGYDFLNQINADSSKHKNLKINIISICDEDEFVTAAKKRNIDISNVAKYNKKPFDMVQLTSALTTDDVALRA